MEFYYKIFTYSSNFKFYKLGIDYKPSYKYFILSSFYPSLLSHRYKFNFFKFGNYYNKSLIYSK